MGTPKWIQGDIGFASNGSQLGWKSGGKWKAEQRLTIVPMVEDQRAEAGGLGSRGTGEARNCNNQPHWDLYQNSLSLCQVPALYFLSNQKTTLFLVLTGGVGGLFQFPLKLEFMRKCWIAVYKCYLSDYWSDSSLSTVGLLAGVGNGYLIGTNDELII